MEHVDGNAVAGELSEVFSLEITEAVATCAGCGETGALASVYVFEAAMGTVLRCPRCDSVLMRVAHMGDETHMEMRGVRVLRWKNVP